MSQTAQTISELAPIKVERVPLDDGRVLVAKKPIFFQPVFHADEDFYTTNYDPLHIILFADSYDELVDIINYDIAWNWCNVVEDSKTALAKSSKNLRENFHECFMLEK